MTKKYIQRSLEPVLKRAVRRVPGAVVLITHDRHMLDRICTDLIGLHGDGRWGNYGSVAQWQEAETQHAETRLVEQQPASAKRESKRQQIVRPKQAGLTYHEKQEWGEMEERIVAAEGEVARLQAELNDPAVAARPREAALRLRGASRRAATAR